MGGPNWKSGRMNGNMMRSKRGTNSPRREGLHDEPGGNSRIKGIRGVGRAGLASLGEDSLKGVGERGSESSGAFVGSSVHVVRLVIDLEARREGLGREKGLHLVRRGHRSAGSISSGSTSSHLSAHEG